MYGTGRPLRRSVMARGRAANSSCMGTSVERPLAVAHGGHSSRTEKGEKAHGAGKACTTDRELSDQLSVRFYAVAECNRSPGFVNACALMDKTDRQLFRENYSLIVTRFCV